VEADAFGRASRGVLMVKASRREEAARRSIRAAPGEGGSQERGSGREPWQLQFFSKTLKKKQKLRLIAKQIGDLGGKRCLLVTHGDNNGALNYHLRARGGHWTWVENEAEHLPEMEELLGEPVLPGSPQRIPAEDETFDLVVSIDVHEHLLDPLGFNRELARVTKPGGMVVVSTPTGETWKPVTVLKNLVGMTKERYGHVVIGYTIRQHCKMLSAVGLVPVRWDTYSRFFTEIIELAINFAYVRVFSRKTREVRPGTIAPTTSRELDSVKRQYRLYSALFPFFWLVSRLDYLLFFLRGYAVSVVARKPQTT